MQIHILIEHEPGEEPEAYIGFSRLEAIQSYTSERFEGDLARDMTAEMFYNGEGSDTTFNSEEPKVRFTWNVKELRKKI